MQITTLKELMDLVKANIGDNDSAKLCYEDAQTLIARGSLESAAFRALNSLRHSVGIFSEHFQTAKTFVKAYHG